MSDPFRNDLRSGPRRPPSQPELEKQLAAALRQKLAKEPEVKAQQQPEVKAQQQPEVKAQGQSRSGTDLTYHVLSSLARSGAAARIVWNQPYCTRGWIRSLNPTVTITATVQCDNTTYKIAQNAHKGGASGSAWIQGDDGSGVKPSDLPPAWTTDVTPALREAIADLEFQQEVRFSDYLTGQGANNLGEGDPWSYTVQRRWLALRAKYGSEAVKRAPGGVEAMENLKSEPVSDVDSILDLN